MSFKDGMEELIDLVEVRRVVDEAGLADVRRLRYAGYLKERAIEANDAGEIRDTFDRLPNNWVFGVYLDGQLASTIRLGLATLDDGRVPAMDVFADVVGPLLAKGERILDPTRFVVDASAAQKHPKLAYVTLRLAWVVADHLDCDRFLASVRTEHQAFYRRFSGHALLCPARPYPSLTKPLSLMTSPDLQTRRHGFDRYPFLKSSREEFERLMEGTSIGRPSRDPGPRAHQSREDHATTLV